MFGLRISMETLTKTVLKSYEIKAIQKRITISVCDNRGHLLTLRKSILVTVTALVKKKKNKRKILEQMTIANSKSSLKNFDVQFSAHHCAQFSWQINNFIVRQSVVSFQFHRLV